MLLTKNRYIMFGGVLLLLAGIIAATAAICGRHDPVTVPEQTAIHVTLDQGLASDQSRPGDHFEATVSEPIVIDDAATSRRIGGNHKKRKRGLDRWRREWRSLDWGSCRWRQGRVDRGPVGAGAGTAVAFITGKKDIHLGAEIPVTFRLVRPVTIDVKG